MTLLGYFLNASFIVQGVMVLLIMASIFSWAAILQGFLFFSTIRQATIAFEKEFWSGEELTALYARIATRQPAGLEYIFYSGFKEFSQMQPQPGMAMVNIVNNTERAMQVAMMRIQDRLEARLPFLAIVASTSPYLGLFGTVWGIMQSFGALAGKQQATIATVAPGIAEALIATALGLFAAIPAVIAYNRLLTGIGRLLNRFHAFQEELINILSRYTLSVHAKVPGEKEP